jgi:hypothetical protein
MRSTIDQLKSRCKGRIIMASGLTQHLTEMSIRNHPGGKGQPERKADNLTDICDPIVRKMWEPMGLHGLLQG